MLRPLTLVLPLLALALPACGSEEPPPAPTSREPAGPPPIPELSSLDPPRPGRATVAKPEWNADQIRFEHPTRDLPAGFATLENVTQIRLGDDSETGLLINHYGSGLRAGEGRMLPATDETRSQHAGRDSNVFTLTVGQEGGALRSESGTVTIEEADESHLAGTFDVSLRSRNMLRETRVRGRFHATPDEHLLAELEHQQAIREQLRNR